MPRNEATNNLLREIYDLRNKVNDIKTEYLGNPDIEYTLDSSDFDDLEDLIVKIEEHFEGLGDSDGQDVQFSEVDGWQHYRG